jgi:hypothetical protein
MTHTIEDAIEILGGTKPRIINVRIDISEQSLVRSLAKQVNKGTALTDRQLELSIKKIEKYRPGLEKNKVDVDQLLLTKRTRYPLREIDRTQSISLQVEKDKKVKILIKYVFSKKFAATWDEIVKELIGSYREEKGRKEILFNERDLKLVVDKLRPIQFDVSDDVASLYTTIEEILINPSDSIPYVDFIDGKIELKNVSPHCIKYLDSELTDVKDSDFLVFLERLKNCGIYHKNSEIIKKITEKAPNNLIKTILVETGTRFRINPEEHDIDTVFDIIDNLKQWPLLILVDEKKDIISQIKTCIPKLLKYVHKEEINIFFRLESDNPENVEFNEFVKENNLNNFIGNNTKVVFITKNRIPKPLFNAEWSPHTALVTSNYEYGKTSAYLSDFPAVYYYNNSLNTRYGKNKGNSIIVQL